VALARKLGIPFVRLDHFDVDPTALELLPGDLARKYQIMPLLLHQGRLVAAVGDPGDNETGSMLRFFTGRQVDLVVATPNEIEHAIEHHYQLASESAEAMEELDGTADVDSEEAERKTLEEAERLSKEKPLVRLVNGIFLDALRRGASDIHIAPGEHQAELWLRIDGARVSIRTFSKGLMPALVSRIKIVGRMDIAEHRVPQDGRARIVDRSRVVDLRISVLPTADGESVVVRVLSGQGTVKGIGELGFSAVDAELLTDLLHRNNGIILVTGPSGAGKSTTLYAALGELVKQNVNIITVEDPVEARMAGIEQVQINAAIGLTFAQALRQILRHDPDVIMVGEIRDDETGKIAVESALTGHLVLSTLHTNDAASAVTRLVEMGIEPYLLGSSLLGVLAQRLVRRNCEHCLAEEKVAPVMRRALGLGEDERFYHGVGCERCSHTGYRGRIAAYELLRVTEPLRRLITSGVTADAVTAQALVDGMVPLTDNALARARRRETSLAEVYRVRLR